MTRPPCLLIGLLFALAGSDADAAQKPGRSVLRVAAPEGSEFEIELLTSFARMHDLSFEAVAAATTAEAIAAVAQDRASVVAGGVLIGSSEDSVAYTIEAFPSRQVVVTCLPASRIEFIEGLRGLPVGFVRGSAVEQAMAGAKVRASSLTGLGSAGEVIASLKAGRIGAGVLRLDEVLRVRARDGALQLGVGIGGRQSLGFAVRKADATLLRSLNEHLARLRSSPSWGQLVERHFGFEVTAALGRARLGDAPLAPK